MKPNTVEMNAAAKQEATASLQRYFREEMQEELGALPAANLLNFILEEIGPIIYNAAVADAQARVLARTGELDAELYLDPFQYWSRLEKRRKPKR